MGGIVKEPENVGLSGTQRAAVVISSLGLEAATAVFQSMPEDEVAEITAAMEKVRDIPDHLREQTVNEFTEQLRCGGQAEILDLRALLERSMGAERAQMVLAKAKAGTFTTDLFTLVNRLDAKRCFDAMRDERPQTLALILCHVESKRAAQILSRFDHETQAQVFLRMGRMKPVTPEVIQRIGEALRKKLTEGRANISAPGGVKRIAEVLCHVDRGVEKLIFESMQTKDADLLDDVRKAMLVFDDLVDLPPQAVQVVLREIDVNDICLALKGAQEKLKELVFNNLSKRAAERLKEEMELQGPKPRKEIDEARQRIVAVVRRLEEEGKIKLSRGADDELVA